MYNLRVGDVVRIKEEGTSSDARNNPGKVIVVHQIHRTRSSLFDVERYYFTTANNEFTIWCKDVDLVSPRIKYNLPSWF